MQVQLQHNDSQINFPMTARDEELEFWATVGESELEFWGNYSIRDLDVLETSDGYGSILRLEESSYV